MNPRDPRDVLGAKADVFAKLPLEMPARDADTAGDASIAIEPRVASIIASASSTLRMASASTREASRRRDRAR